MRNANKNVGGGLPAPDLSTAEAIAAYLGECGTEVVGYRSERGTHSWTLKRCYRCGHEPPKGVHVWRDEGGEVTLRCEGCLDPVGPGYTVLYEPAPEEPTAEARKTQAAELLDLAADLPLFHTPTSEPYAALPQGGGHVAVRVDDKRLAQHLTRRYYEAHGRLPSAQAQAEAVGMLAARATFDGPERPVHLRVAEHEGAVYVDLGDEAGRVAEVRADGWDVRDAAPVMFRRTRAMRPLPEPVRGRHPGEGLGRLGRHVRAGAHGLVLLMAFLVQALRPRGPYPVLVLQGEQGTGKSHASRALRSLVDPSEVPVRAAPGGEHDLVIMAENQHVVALDNVSGIGPALSDAFCRLATGGGFGTRRLYSGRDEEVFYVQRPLVLNGIEAAATRPDLGDRAVTVELLPIPKGERKTEAELAAAFEADRGALFGGLLDALSASLRYAGDVALDDLPRMADFAVNAVAASRVFPADLPPFLEAFERSRLAAVEDALAASPVGAGVVALLAGRRSGVWEGTTGELIDAVRPHLPDPARPGRDFPRTPQAMAGALRRIEPALRAVGVTREEMPRQGPKGRRVFRLALRRDEPSPASPSAPSETAAPADETDVSGVGDAGHLPPSLQNR